jgi:hypothetical protein
VLNIVGRPKALSRCIVTFVEKGVKSLKNECLIFSWFVLGFLFLLALSRSESPSRCAQSVLDN